jgi:hypothetical protein
MSEDWTNLLYKRIVNLSKIFKISKNSFQNLDYPPGRGYYVYMSNGRTNNKRLPEAPVAERPPIGAKGDFYGRTEKFSGMA